MRWKVAILTASDRGARGERESTSALVIRELVEEELHGDIIEDRVVPDEMDEVMAALIEMSEYHQADLILTTGGSGLQVRDVTPEATRQVVDREIPGFGELIRGNQASRRIPSALFRGTAGLRGSTLIVNLPSRPKGVSMAMMAIMADLEAAMRSLSGQEEAPEE
ncbi:MogA/MoaB family molybdenum cofactor biosynthesis protein [Paenibacillus antri]|uniref:MogA/MoaB family molybdenum cofactor biosynthesis protein n=1 Tax=Paenibacillus antri TaxID=2582848 RepID=A0A5R9G6G1_9BACL|nr:MULTISPECIES: MogA/MoaB family molybdenum cofactor biosynthesis protein [Paenibacillus]TLS51967.1 MogA/MoaB family molybdenum cofactor biosynthesis protein [Paenibacillus antri]